MAKTYFHPFHCIKCWFIEIAIISMKSKCMANEIHCIVTQTIFSVEKHMETWSYFCAERAKNNRSIHFYAKFCIPKMADTWNMNPKSLTHSGDWNMHMMNLPNNIRATCTKNIFFTAYGRINAVIWKGAILTTDFLGAQPWRFCREIFFVADCNEFGS